MSTEVYDPEELEGIGIEGEGPEEKGRKRRILALVLLGLLALPLACWAGARLGPGFISMANRVTEVAAAGSQEELEATLTALSTELAPQEGTVMATGEVETKVAQTVTAMAEAGEGLVLASVTPTVTLEGDALLSGTPTDAGFSTATVTGNPLLATEPQSSPTNPASSTPNFTPTRTHTLPPGVTPSATHTPTRTYTSTLTRTPTLTLSPTITITPTQTQTFTPTRTKTQSPTPTEDICASLVLDGFNVDGKKVMWDVTNNTAQKITITEIYLDWPSAGVKLKKVKSGGKEIWDIGDEDPPTRINSNWKGNLKERQLDSGKMKEIKFEFDEEPGPSGYDFEISFDIGCTLESHK